MDGAWLLTARTSPQITEATLYTGAANGADSKAQGEAPESLQEGTSWQKALDVRRFHAFSVLGRRVSEGGVRGRLSSALWTSLRSMSQSSMPISCRCNEGSKSLLSHSAARAAFSDRGCFTLAGCSRWGGFEGLPLPKQCAGKGLGGLGRKRGALHPCFPRSPPSHPRQ